MPIKTLPKPNRRTAEADSERIAVFMTPDLAQLIRIEAAVNRETLSGVIERRLVASYRRDPAPSVAVAN
jgi:hypothetical protein